MDMEPYYDQDGITICRGDCREVRAYLQENAIDSIVTDPPYGLEFVGKERDHGVPGEQFWRTFSGVCKPGAMMLAFAVYPGRSDREDESQLCDCPYWGTEFS